MFENFISELCYIINYQIKVTARAQSVASCIWCSKDFQVIPFLHPITSLTLQIDFIFNKLTPGNEWANCPWASEAPGCCWQWGNQLNRFHIFVHNQNSLTAEPWRQTLAPLEFPCASCLLPALLEEQSTEELFQDVGTRPTQNSSPGIHQWGVSQSAGLMLSQCHVTKCWGKERKNLPPKCQGGGRDKEKTPKFRFGDIWMWVKAANLDNLMFVTSSNLVFQGCGLNLSPPIIESWNYEAWKTL